ncbi:hypothetical protein HDU86_006350 [Geranomyces michiganensis]|nr:hypothetical protein HDU86_006350 [Geranomyces michiganensis]
MRSSNITHMIACGNANAVELGFFGCDKDGSWANWTLGDGMGVEAPLNSAQENTFLVGLAVDVTSEEELPPDTPDAPPTPPVPILLTYTTEGLLLAYHCLDDAANGTEGRCQMMCRAEAIPGLGSVPSAKLTATTQLAPTAAQSAAQTSAPESRPSLFGAAKPVTSLRDAPTAGPPTTFGAQLPAQGTTPLSQEQAPTPQAAPKFPAVDSGSKAGSKAALPGQSSAFGAALKVVEPAKTSTATAFGPSSGLFGGQPTTPSPISGFGLKFKPSEASVSTAAGGESTASKQQISETQKPATSTQSAVASGLTGVRGLAGPKPSLPTAISYAPTVKSQTATPAAAQTGSIKPASKNSPIPTVQSVVKPALAATARQSPQPAAMQPLLTPAPAESDPPEIVQSKFIEMYDAFCDEMKNFGSRLKASAKTVEKAKTPILTSGQPEFDEWTLADLPLLVDRTAIVGKKARLYQQRLVALHEETKALLASLPQEVALANECQRRLDAIDDPDTAQHMHDAPLGPEDAELRNSILQRYKSVEQSLQRVQDYMEQLRCEERGASNRQLLRKPDWQTICAITTHITRGTENHLRALERLQICMHNLQPKSKTPAAAAATKSPKQRGYGLLSHSDSDSESDRDDELVSAAAKADASSKRQIAFRALLKATASDPARKARLNQRAHTNHAALRLKDPEAFVKARAAMLLPPSDPDKAAPQQARTPRTTSEVLDVINVDMKFSGTNEMPEVVQQNVVENTKQESPQPALPQPPSFSFGSPGTSVFNTPSKVPAGGLGSFGKPPAFGVPVVAGKEKAGAGAGWIKIETEPLPPVSAPVATNFDADTKVESVSVVSFARSPDTKTDMPSDIPASPSPAPKSVVRKLSFSTASVGVGVLQPPGDGKSASVHEDEVSTSSALGSESGWVNLKSEQPGSYEESSEQQTPRESAEPSSAEEYNLNRGQLQNSGGDNIEISQQTPDVPEEASQEDGSGYAQQEDTADVEEGEVVSPEASAQGIEESISEELSNVEYAEEGEPPIVENDREVAPEERSTDSLSYAAEHSSEDDGEADVTAIQGESTIPEESTDGGADASGEISVSVADIAEEVDSAGAPAEKEASSLEPSSIEEPVSPTSAPRDEHAMDAEGQVADGGLASAFGTGFESLGGSSSLQSSSAAKPSVFGGFGAATTTPVAFSSAATVPAFGSSLPKPAASAFGASAVPPSSFGMALQQGTPASSSAATSVFGQATTPAPAPSFGFGTSASSTPASAFARTATPFGQPAAMPSASAFGSAVQPAASAFGQGTPSSSSSSTNFGSAVPATVAFGQSQATSFGFGSSGGSGMASAFGSPFGGSMASAAGAQFGSRPAGFGPSAFGASPAAGAAGGGAAAGGSAFGGSPLAASAGGLGAMAQSIKQASQSGGGFGSYATKPAGFASAASPGFGGFGAQQPAQSGFGGFGSQQQQQTPQQQPTFGGFGNAAGAAGLQQSSAAASVFGSPAQTTASPFAAGGAGGSVFGGQQQQASGGFAGFAAAANGGGFGQQQPAAASVFGSSTNNGTPFGSSGGTPNFASFGSHRG